MDEFLLSLLLEAVGSPILDVSDILGEGTLLHLAALVEVEGDDADHGEADSHAKSDDNLDLGGDAANWWDCLDRNELGGQRFLLVCSQETVSVTF